MNLQAKKTPSATGIYVHVPFCAATCDFCGFYQKKPHDDDFERYLHGIRRELELYGKPLTADTVFWGGGTPGLLGPRELTTLGRDLLKFMDALPKEWTVEMAPAFVTDRKLRALRDLGVNRISLGVQSFQERMLEQLGRQHTVRQVVTAIDRVRQAGFEQLNLDLIFAIPGQDWTGLKKDLEAVRAVAPEHLSTYCLTFEEDTALFIRLSEGKVSIDTDREAELYRRCWGWLEDAGYQQYEVSNFCLPGFACMHNMNTWTLQNWIGLGPAAASQVDGLRYTNVPDLDRWLAGLERGSPERVDTMALSPGLLAADSLVFGLRMNRGVNLPDWSARFGIPVDFLNPLLETWDESGFLYNNEDSEILRLSRKGRLLADALGAEILEHFDSLASPAEDAAASGSAALLHG